MGINEKIITGRKWRRLIDKDSKLWQLISWWTKASDVEFDDGKTAEEKVGNINGITSDIEDDSEDIAASMKVISDLKQSFQDGVNSIYELLTKLGFTPDSKSLDDILNSIKEMHKNRFEEGISKAEGTLTLKLTARQKFRQSTIASYLGNKDTSEYKSANVKISISNGSAKIISATKSVETADWLSDGINNNFYAVATIESAVKFEPSEYLAPDPNAPNLSTY
ncbi:MAG: hypothetical protein HDR18_03110 [Lachnospiraceae bacterium]|nr:hypothetical protein [Lachnospiraceae bacterium]